MLAGSTSHCSGNWNSHDQRRTETVTKTRTINAALKTKLARFLSRFHFCLQPPLVNLLAILLRLLNHICVSVPEIGKVGVDSGWVGKVASQESGPYGLPNNSASRSASASGGNGLAHGSDGSESDSESR